MAHIQGKQVTAVTIEKLVELNHSTDPKLVLSDKVDAVFLLGPPNKIQEKFFYYEVNPTTFSGPIIATLGEFSTGKSWFFNKFCCNFNSGDDLNTAGLNFKQIRGEETVGIKANLIICDTQGSDQALQIKNVSPATVNEMFHEKKAEDLILRNVIYNMADVFVFICNDMSFEQQSQIDNFATMLSDTKNAALKEDSRRAKQCSNHIYVIHNFRSIKKFTELMKKWEEVKRNYGHIAVQKIRSSDSQGDYTIEYLGDEEFSQRHFFLGCENASNFANGETDIDYLKIRQMNDRTISQLKKMLLIEVNKHKEVKLPKLLGTAIQGALDRSVIISKQDETPNDLTWFKHPKWALEKEESQYKGVYQLRYKGKNIAVKIREDIADVLNNSDEISENISQKMYSSSFPFQVNITEYQNEAYVIDILAGLVKGENDNYHSFCVLSEEKVIFVDEKKQLIEQPTTNTDPLQAKGYSVRRVKKGIIVKLIRSPSLLVHPMDDKFRPTKDGICEYTTAEAFKENIESKIQYESQNFKYGDVYSQFFPVPDGYVCRPAIKGAKTNPKQDRTEYKFPNGLLRIVCPASESNKAIPDTVDTNAYAKSILFIIQDFAVGNGMFLFTKFNLPNPAPPKQHIQMSELDCISNLDKHSLIIWCTNGELKETEYKKIRNRFNNVVAARLFTANEDNEFDRSQVDDCNFAHPLGVGIDSTNVKAAPIFTFVCNKDHYFIDDSINMDNGKLLKRWVIENYL